MLTLRMHSSRTSTRCRRTTPHTTSSSQRAPTAALPLQMSEPDSARNTPRRSRSAADEGLNESQYGRSKPVLVESSEAIWSGLAVIGKLYRQHDFTSDQ